MDGLKKIRWQQRFVNFKKSFLLLEKYSNKTVETELEQAGIIQLFEVSFELAWKVMKDYLEAAGFSVRSPRETIKQAFQMELIDDGHVWMDALRDRNLAVHVYDEVFAKKMADNIILKYYPEFKKLYQKLESELDNEQSKEL